MGRKLCETNKCLIFVKLERFRSTEAVNNKKKVSSLQLPPWMRPREPLNQPVGGRACACTIDISRYRTTGRRLFAQEDFKGRKKSSVFKPPSRTCLNKRHPFKAPIV
jgi:hypothetical protein